MRSAVAPGNWLDSWSWLVAAVVTCSSRERARLRMRLARNVLETPAPHTMRIVSTGIASLRSWPYLLLPMMATPGRGIKQTFFRTPRKAASGTQRVVTVDSG